MERRRDSRQWSRQGDRVVSFSRLEDSRNKQRKRIERRGWCTDMTLFVYAFLSGDVGIIVILINEKADTTLPMKMSAMTSTRVPVGAYKTVKVMVDTQRREITPRRQLYRRIWVLIGESHFLVRYSDHHCWIRCQSIEQQEGEACARTLQKSLPCFGLLVSWRARVRTVKVMVRRVCALLFISHGTLCWCCFPVRPR